VPDEERHERLGALWQVLEGGPGWGYDDSGGTCSGEGEALMRFWTWAKRAVPLSVNSSF
jgi:hypothetical protein